IVVWAQHRGRRGHPVGFAAELYSELVQLDGDDDRAPVAHGADVLLGAQDGDAGLRLEVGTPLKSFSVRDAPMARFLYWLS
ncbi:MAG: hypothetical protein RLZZ341_2066, partial [Pseudomonadota bacterium]